MAVNCARLMFFAAGAFLIRQHLHVQYNRLGFVRLCTTGLIRYYKNLYGSQTHALIGLRLVIPNFIKIENVH